MFLKIASERLVTGTATGRLTACDRSLVPPQQFPSPSYGGLHVSYKYTGMSVRNRRRNTLPIIAEPTVPITVDDCRGSERHASLYLLRDVPFFGTVSSLTRRSSISSWVKLVHVWFLTHMHGIINMRTAGLGVVSPSEICESIRFRKLMLSEFFSRFHNFSESDR